LSSLQWPQWRLNLEARRPLRPFVAMDVSQSGHSPLARTVSQSSQCEPAELQDIGDAPFNEYHATLIGDRASSSFCGYMPAGGFSGRLARADPSSKLREALALSLEVPVSGISLVYEGKNLEDAQTLKENGILEPGPAAKKRGQGKISMQFMLSEGVELGRAKRDKMEAAEVAQKEMVDRQAAEQKLLEERRAAREEADQKMREQAAEEAKIAADAQAAAQDRIALRCRLLDAAEADHHEVQTLLTVTVRDLAFQICQERGMRRDDEHDQIMLVHGDNVLAAGMTLRDAGVKTGDEIVYFWG